jgi:putative ABC transport system permease protein
MNIGAVETVRMSLAGVWTHRFRSALTVLGIVVGITTVVTVASMLTGLRQGIVDFFQELGPDNIFVSRTSGDPSRDSFVRLDEARRRRLYPEYAEFIRRSCYSVKDVGLTLFLPDVIDGNPIIARVPGYESDNILVEAISPNMEQMVPRDLQAGRPFTTAENARGLHVALLGFDAAEALFPAGNAVGHAIMMDGAEYQVIGVYAKAKGGFFGENNEDHVVSMPLATAERRYPQLTRFQITAQAKPGRRADAYDEVRAAMRRIRNLAPGAPDDFTISTPDQIVQQFDSITGVIGAAAIAISALGLLVGGIGVMNVLLMSVTERTREIGVRKAIGARRGDIIAQFLLEAMTLTGLGGLLGLLIAVAVTLLLGALVPSLPSVLPAWAIAAGFTVSLAVGLFFGVWPAVKAARLDPVEALRYE